jgi:hypothetical protein
VLKKQGVDLATLSETDLHYYGLALDLIESKVSLRVGLDDARKSVKEMTRFFELFEEYDPEVRRVRERSERELAESLAAERADIQEAKEAEAREWSARHGGGGER